jgi:hypothetical protein
MFMSVDWTVELPPVLLRPLASQLPPPLSEGLDAEGFNEAQHFYTDIGEHPQTSFMSTHKVALPGLSKRLKMKEHRTIFFLVFRFLIYLQQQNN